MKRKNENSRQSRKVIHIVCEGTHTEPQFFASIRDRILARKFDIGDYELNIIPKPIFSDDVVHSGASRDRGSYSSKKIRRATKPEEAEEGFSKGYPPPLNWVITAQEKLRENNGDEAWAVFDKDGHPAMADAFAAAEELINGRTVGIAFSSRSFEYYMLLHFEYIYKRFDATECGVRINKNKKSLKCMLPEAKEGSCLGDVCINGYARSKGHWKASKSNESMFPLVEDRLYIGIVHAHRLRTESNREDTCHSYERNPYVTTDKLICRLTNTHVFDCGQPADFKYTGVYLSVLLTLKSEFTIINTSANRSVILPKGFFQVLNCDTNIVTSLNEKTIFVPQMMITYQLSRQGQTEVVVLKNESVEGSYLFINSSSFS